MGIIIKPRDRVKELERENRQLKAALQQAQADTAFIAIMTDVNLPDIGEEAEV